MSLAINKKLLDEEEENTYTQHAVIQERVDLKMSLLCVKNWPHVQT